VTDQAIPRAAIIVAMPDGIDYGTADQAYGQLYARSPLTSRSS
jgi:hypothetical protein